jgi:hypothetical protein
MMILTFVLDDDEEAVEEEVKTADTKKAGKAGKGKKK